MKRSHMYTIVQGYEAMPDLGAGSTAKFDYFADKNNDVATREIKHREAALKPSDKWLELEQAREAVNQKHAIKDEKGAYALEGEGRRQRYTFTPEAEALRVKEMAELDDASKDVIADRQKILDDYARMMDEEMPAEELAMFHTIKRDNMPALGKRLFAVWSPLVIE